MSELWKEPNDYRQRPVCVLGGGVLGRRIAACYVAAGYQVRIRDPSEKSRNDALTYITENLKAFQTLIPYPVDPGNAVATEDFAAAVKDCWIVFEAVPEILSIKESTFQQLEESTPEDCILASNSSSFKSGELLGKVKDSTKARVLNTHYMMPPQAIIVELMTSGHTAPNVFAFVEARHKEAGLHPVTALKESSGFIFNRIWAAIKRECLAVLSEGVSTPEVIDSIWREQYGSKVGPCAMMGVGLDTVEHIEQHYIVERNLPDSSLKWLHENYVAKGKLGIKTGDKGGLYEATKPGQLTKVLFLNIGLSEPLAGKTPAQYLKGGEVLQLTLGDPNARPIALLSNQALPDGIDTLEGRMYWTCMGTPGKNDGIVQSAKLDGTDIQTIVPAGHVNTPKQLYIDGQGRKLYFCDREGLRVMRCNFDGSERETIVQTGDWRNKAESRNQTLWPVGVAVSNRLQKVFWTQKGAPKSSEGRIFSAPLKIPQESTASNRTDIEIVASSLPECIDLEIDDENGILYWTDRGEVPLGNTLNKKHITGSAPETEIQLGRQIIAQGLGEGIGLRLDKADNCIYVADLAGRLWKCNPHGGLKQKLYEGPTGCYTGVTFVKS